MIINREIIEASFKGAHKGCMSFSAASIISGAAMVSVPVKVLGFITVGSSTVVSAPIVTSMAICGALAVGGFQAFMCHKISKKSDDYYDVVMAGSQVAQKRC